MNLDLGSAKCLKSAHSERCVGTLQPPARAFLRGWRVTKNEKVYQLRWAAWFKKERLEGRLEGDEERYILSCSVLRLLLLLLSLLPVGHRQLS